MFGIVPELKEVDNDTEVDEPPEAVIDVDPGVEVTDIDFEPSPQFSFDYGWRNSA